MKVNDFSRPKLLSENFITGDTLNSYPLLDNRGDERGCDDGHLHAPKRGLPWGLPEVIETVQQMHCSRRRLLRKGLTFHMCIINKSAHTKTSGNLFNDPCIYIYIYIHINIYINTYIHICTHTHIHICTHTHIHILLSTDRLFRLSQLFRVVRHAGCLGLGLKRGQLYDRLISIPPNQHSYHVTKGIIMY